MTWGKVHPLGHYLSHPLLYCQLIRGGKTMNELVVESPGDDVHKRRMK